MPRFTRRSLLLAATCGACLPALAQKREARPLLFGLITPRAAEQTRKHWLPFAERLSASLQQPVNLQLFDEPTELVSRFTHGTVDLAWMGNSAALDAVLTGNASVFAQMITKEGSAGYQSILVVPTRSPLKTVTDAIKGGKGLRFGDGDLKSTSGHAVPAYFAFQKNGVDNVNTVFKTVTHYNHQKNLTLVANEELDLATANNEELAFFERDFPALAGKLRILWESPLIPQSPLVWRNSLPLDLKRRILQFVIDFGKSDDQKRILEDMNSLSGFRQSSNRQLAAVADVEMFKARQAIVDDTSLTPEERTRRIDEVIRRSSRLDLILKLSVGPLR